MVRTRVTGTARRQGGRRGSFVMLRTAERQASFVICAALLAGCVMHSTTREQSDTTQILYQISEREAFTAILDIYAIELPKQSVDDVVEGHYRGYNATARFWMDWTDHRILVIPAKGIDKNGRAGRGYWYDIHSSGSRGVAGGGGADATAAHLRVNRLAAWRDRQWPATTSSRSAPFSARVASTSAPSARSIALVATGWQAYRRAETALRQASINHLTSIREERRLSPPSRP